MPPFTFGALLDPLLRYTRNPATANLPSILTPPFNPSTGSALPATLGQARGALPQPPPQNPALIQRPVTLPTGGDVPVPTIARGPNVQQLPPEMTETRRVGAPAPHLTQSLPLARMGQLPTPPPITAPTGADGGPIASRPPSPSDKLDVPQARSKFWDVLKSAGYGAMIGAQRNPNNPWAMVGGAAAGGIGAFKAPSSVDTLRYEAVERPREDAELLRQYQQDKMAGELALGREKVQSERTERETRKVAAETAKQREDRLAKEAQERLELQRKQLEYQQTRPLAARPTQVQTPDGRTIVIDANTQKELGVAPAKPEKPMTRAEALAELDAEEGTVDEIVGDSFNDARIQSLLDKLSPREKAFVTGQLPPVIEGQSDVQYQAELAQANNKWQKLQADEKTRMVRETTRTRQAGANARIAGTKPLAANPSKVTKGQASGSKIKLSDAAELLRKLKGQ